MRIYIVVSERGAPLGATIDEKKALDEKSRYEHNSAPESGKEAKISTFELPVRAVVLCDGNGQPLGVYSSADAAARYDAPERHVRFFPIDEQPITNGGVPA